MDTSEANDLPETAERLAADSQSLRDALAWESLRDQVTEVVNEEYDLGPVQHVEPIHGGYVNLSFGVRTQGPDGEHAYFVRKYNADIKEREARFEHALINHVVERGLHIAARVHETRDGGTLAWREETSGGQRLTRYFAVYELLPGSNDYEWTRNRLTDELFAGAARVLAQFHHCAADFEPSDLVREQPPIMQMLAGLQARFDAFAGQSRGSAFDEYYLAKLPRVREAVAAGLGIAADLDGLAYLPIHCDYHAGNLKYDGQTIVGLFDFDWSKLDYRVFDLGLALAYFCDSWEGADSGELRLDKVALFLRAYQEESARWSDPGPLDARELALLPRMIATGNLYVLHWDVADYYGDSDPSVEEYLGFLKHNAMVLEFIEEHFAELTTLCSRAARR